MGGGAKKQKQILFLPPRTPASFGGPQLVTSLSLILYNLFV